AWRCQPRTVGATTGCPPKCRVVGAACRRRLERSLSSIPRQGDFPRDNVPTGKDARRSIHWKLDDRPISMKLYEFAAINGPEQTSAPEMHQRVIAMATEQGSRIPA